MPAPILFDVTSIMRQPFRSGIQRAQREVLRHWPGPERIVPVAIDPSGAVRILPDAVRGLLCPPADARPTTYAEDRAALRALVARAEPEIPPLSAQILNLELFFEPWRAEAYRRFGRMGWRVQFLVYDFIPWLHPEPFPQGTAAGGMHYLRALRAASDMAFISRQTATEHARRIARRGATEEPGTVLPLGADGLGLERQRWSPGRRSFVVIGTMEQRKNIGVVIEAFRRLWAEGIDARVVLAGRIASTHAAPVRDFAAGSGGRATILDHPVDADVRAALREARAVLSPSEIEGFGLPPYEAMHCGIPAIAAASLPSMQLLPPRGHVALPAMTPDAVAAAVRAMLDDTASAALWAEAATVQLPTWRDFALHVARWASAPPDAAGATLH